MNSLIDRFFGDHKSITLMGMSGVGKTRLASRLPSSQWFHYSVDYRIGTHYLGDRINDDLKAMVFRLGRRIDDREPDILALQGLLRSDSITVKHKITFHNLEPLSKYLGGLGLAARPNLKPGEEAPTTTYFDGVGRDLGEFTRRQHLHRAAEIDATHDIGEFKIKAQHVYGYPHFINDASGSLCEIVAMTEVTPGRWHVDADDPTLQVLRNETLLIYVEASDTHVTTLLDRNAADPKPIYYRPEVLARMVDDFMRRYDLADPAEIHPASFSRYAFPRLLRERVPRYKALADAIGITISLEDVRRITADHVTDTQFLEDFTSLVTRAVAARPVPI